MFNPDLTLILVWVSPWFHPSPWFHLHPNSYEWRNGMFALTSHWFHLVRFFNFILIFLSSLNTGSRHSDFRSKNSPWVHLCSYIISSWSWFHHHPDFTLAPISPSLGFIIIFIWYQQLWCSKVTILSMKKMQCENNSILSLRQNVMFNMCLLTSDNWFFLTSLF